MSSLWQLAGDQKQLARFRQAISDPANVVFISVVSLWKIAVKHGLGKLPLPQAPQTCLPAMMRRDGFACLPLDEASVLLLPTLPDIHHDSFDRMLMCQALAHNLTFLSVDRYNLAYLVVKFL